MQNAIDIGMKGDCDGTAFEFVLEGQKYVQSTSPDYVGYKFWFNSDNGIFGIGTNADNDHFIDAVNVKATGGTCTCINGTQYIVGELKASLD